MTAALPDREDVARQARELYAAGRSLRQGGAALGIAHTTVRFLLAGGDQPPRRRHLRVVPDAGPAFRPAPERVAMAYTADRGWHLVQAPPAWALDLLAELD